MSKGDHATTPVSGGASSVRTGTQAANPEAIAKRAYELFLQRGSVPGNEVDDWLQAEAELTNRGQERGEQSREDSRGDSRQDRSKAQSKPEAQAAVAPSSSTGEPASRPDSRDQGGGSTRRGARQPTSH